MKLHGRNEDVQTGNLMFVKEFGKLPAGNHTLKLGGLLNYKGSVDEKVSVVFDNIDVIGELPYSL